MYSRRDFLRSSTLVALAPTIPSFLAQTAQAVEAGRDGRILVVIELNGGNDGINTVVPFADEGYAKYRSVLRLPADRLLKIDKGIGLHPAMGAAAKLLEGGRMAIVQGVGYPNPNRSHFKSLAIWHTANVNLPREDAPDAETGASFGWIGQALDEGRKQADGSPAAQFVGSGAVPQALRGRRSVSAALSRLENSVVTLPGIARAAPAEEPQQSLDLAAFVRRSTLDAYATSQRMADVLRAVDSGARYPTIGLARGLRLIARLIKAGGGTRVYYTAQPGYDTHGQQADEHARLLGDLSGSLLAFLDDLKAAGLADRVLVLCFSEFGRRVAENASQGTDHGTAGPVFLGGSAVRAGLVGETPKLLDLQDGDLKMSIDFRQVYATVLEDWLGLPSKPALGADFPKMDLLRI